MVFQGEVKKKRGNQFDDHIFISGQLLGYWALW